MHITVQYVTCVSGIVDSNNAMHVCNWGPGHSKNVSMGWYDNNCICMDEYTLRADSVWAQKSYLGDVQLVLDAGFDSGIVPSVHNSNRGIKNA